MRDNWQLQEAKNKLSHLVKQARTGHPQYISVHGHEAVVMLSAGDYRRLRAPSGKLSETLLMPEIDGETLDFSRSREPARALEL